MQSPEDSLIHEASALYRLVDSIDRFVAEQQSSYTYTDSTEALFRYVRISAQATKQQVSTIIAESARRPADIERRYRPELIIQKNQWRTLHTYIKPASDAHTLSLPVPLLNLAKSHLRSVKGMEHIDIVPLLTPELMYYHNLPRIGVGENLVFVELPYSQGPGLFTNLTIYHELAHFVFEKLETDETKGSVVEHLAKAMASSFDSKLGQRITTAPTRTWAKRVLRDWTREVFCDLFATRFLGPASMFALIDVLSLIGLMREGTAAIEFDKEHPAPALRLKEQVNQLKRDDWWQTVQDLPTTHVTLAEQLVPKADSDYEFVFDDKNVEGFVETFLEIVPHIYPVVEWITPPARNSAVDFGNTASDIERCFLKGVVPSHLLQQGKAESPTQVSIINAAYCFYLTSMPKLMDKIGEDPGSLAKRSELTAKLEAWALKALEDHQLYAATQRGE